MKRPLFWAVVMFALGEVICIMPIKTMLSGMLFCMPIFIGAITVFIRKKYDISVVLCMVIAGFLVMHFNIRQPIRTCLHMENGTENMSEVWADVAVEGVVTGIEEATKNLTVEVHFTEITDSYCGVVGTVEDTYKVIIFGYEDDVKIGAEVSIKGRLTVPESARNPGGFDFYSYYEAKGILFYLMPDIVSVDNGAYSKAKELLRSVKAAGVKHLYQICDEETASVYEGMLFGNKKAVGEDTKELYRMSGIAHILAISGLHISIVSGFFYLLLRKLNIPLSAAFIVSVFAAFLYGAMAGFGMATLRAVIMLVISMLGARLGKSYDMLTGLALAVLIMLLANPMSIKDQSLILSVAAIFGVCLGVYINRCILKKKKIKQFLKKHKLFGRLISSFIVSLSVNLVTFPIIAYMYFEIPLYSVFLNIIVVSGMTIVISMGFAGVALSFASVGLGRLCIMIGGLFIKMFEYVANAFMRLPFSVINTGKPKPWQIALYYAVMIFVIAITNREVFEGVTFWIFKRIKYKPNLRKLRTLKNVVAIFAVISYVLVSVCIHFFSHREMLAFLDVGQGDGIVISTPDNTVVVIDGGSGNKKGEALGKYTLVPALKSLGMARVDFWVVTHGDSDHVNGLIYILENYDMSGINIGSIVMARYGANSEYIDRILELAEKNNIDVVYVGVGDMIEDDSAGFMCCYPDGKSPATTNDSSIVLSYRSENISCLFLGDISSEGISHMMSECGEYMEKEYNVVKVAHHGSRNSVYEPLYNLCSGNVAVISCGKNNLYGHPHEEVLEGLCEYGCNIFRTDEGGAIIVKTGDGEVCVQTFRE